MKSRRIILSVVMVAGTLLSSSGAWAQGARPSTVYVFNGGTPQNPNRDGFNAGCQGWVFQAMGLLGPHGEPPTVDGDNLKAPDGSIVGTVIRDANNAIIGYRSADGTKEAYNIDTSATARQAWQRVADRGEFVVAKHGTVAVEGEGDEERITGTGITLDGGRSYPGFRPRGGTGGGTGSGGEPYELPGRPGAGIGVYLNGCYTSHDPDGAGTDRKSGTDSVKDVPGVDPTRVRGNDGVIYKGPNISVDAGGAANNARAEAALRACAKAAGFTMENDAGEKVGDVGAWIASLPFERQRQAAVDCLAAARVRGATVTVSYTKSTSECGEDGCIYYAPVQLVDPSGARIDYQASPAHASMDLMIAPGALPTQMPLALRTLAPESGLPPLPPGLAPAAPIAWVSRYDQQPMQFFGPAMLVLNFLPSSRPPVGLFTVQDQQWIPYPGNVDPTGLVVTQLDGGRVLALLEPYEPLPPPCPADFNADGVVNSQDFFDFIGAFFAVDPAADFNGDGTVNSQDFFDFVTEFFRIC